MRRIVTAGEEPGPVVRLGGPVLGARSGSSYGVTDSGFSLPVAKYLTQSSWFPNRFPRSSCIVFPPPFTHLTPVAPVATLSVTTTFHARSVLPELAVVRWPSNGDAPQRPGR